MSNIIWKTPSGALAITTLTPECIELMANHKSTIAENDRTALEAEKEAIQKRLSELEVEIKDAENDPESLSLKMDEQGVLISSNIHHRISALDHAEDFAARIGLSAAEHAAKLQLPQDDGKGGLVHSHDPSWESVATGAILPTEHSDFREAWRWDGTSVVVDVVGAAEVTKSRLRQERAPLLAALDVQFQRNLEEGKDNAAVVAEKKRLRDITKEVDKVQSLDELRMLSAK